MANLFKTSQLILRETKVSAWNHKILEGLTVAFLLKNTEELYEDSRGQKYLKVETRWLANSSIQRRGLIQPNASYLLLPPKVLRTIERIASDKHIESDFGVLIKRWDSGGNKMYSVLVTTEEQIAREAYQMITNCEYKHLYALYNARKPKKGWYSN